MEELNNRQMVLLTMFTSFVVSIATGIITVAMLQEAPETLTQTVNRVVEHTIERVVTGTSTPENTAPATTITNVTKETTIYAKEEDLLISAVEKNQPRVVKIYQSGSATTSDPKTIGFVVSRDGLVATEPRSLFGDGVPDEKYNVIIGGRQYVAEPIAGQDGETKEPVFFLKLTDLVATDILDSVTYVRTEDPKLGQTIVVLGSADGSGIFKTTLSRFQFNYSNGTSSPTQILVGIETLPKIADQNSGGLVVNLDGQAVGVVIPDSAVANKFIIYPISRILELVGAKAKVKATNTLAE